MTPGRPEDRREKRATDTNLTDLGWQPFFEQHFAELCETGDIPARVARQEKTRYLLYGEAGELTAEVSGKLRHDAASRADLPVVGDWVVITPRPNEDTATIHAVLPRKSSFSRKQAGAITEAQVVAANVDTAFLVSGLDGGRNFNLARIERYLTLAYESSANPVIVLNKSDVCDEVERCVQDVERIALGVPIHPVSALTTDGLDDLRAYLTVGQTVVFLGSSGVGKSTLINSLLGDERLAVAAVRKGDHQGRHTTTWRELILLPDGGMLIDTPGMRELQMWGNEDAMRTGFQDIEALAEGCRFRDCRHRGEPGCAVKAAVADGTLDAGRLESYRKQERELAHLARKQSQKARLIEKAKWKQIGKWIRDFTKHSPKRREE